MDFSEHPWQNEDVVVGHIFIQELKMRVRCLDPQAYVIPPRISKRL